MDMKGNRPTTSPKGPVADSKKDVSKQWPRNGRRREPASSTFSNKGEPSRKPQAQRDRTFDKRPKPRNGYHTGAVVRTPPTWLEEEEAELGSVFLPGSKKQSLNHLLNFSYATYSPREGHQSERSCAKKGNGERMLATKKHKYNKEHFLQANCQFVVNDSGDYKQYLNDPDALVDWNLVEQVKVQVAEYPSCPICLYPPAAAKMTRCGHIYCWSCILHYLSLSDKSSRKCPICYDTIHKQDLKSVVAIPHSTFNVNETITFTLMKRPKDCLTAYPFKAKVRDSGFIFNMCDRGMEGVYSKLLLANYGDILSIISREGKELEAQFHNEEDCLERCFIEQAMALLKEREGRVLEKIGESRAGDGGAEVPDNSVGEVNDLVESLDISQDSEQQSKFHYFYQASDGQHIYLHAINARMLEHSHGYLYKGPEKLTGRILEKEGGSMTEELRKRLRYLQHLPVTCQFEVAEIQLKPPDVKRETLEHFQGQIELRRKKRQRHAKEEKRREKRIEAEENRKMGKYPVPNLHLDSNIQFPEFGFEPRLRTESECTIRSDCSSSSDPMNVSSPSLESKYSGPSFVAVLSTEKKKPPTWPILKSSPSTSQPIKFINVTGVQMKVASNIHISSSNDIEEGYEPVPAYRSNFGDAITQALQLQMIKEKTEDDGSSPSSKGKKKKKNKSRQKLLFTTNMACSGN